MFKKRKFPHRITIEQAVTGCFIVQVGCATIPFNDANTVLYALSKYFADPKKMQAEYYNHEKCAPDAPDAPEYSPLGSDSEVEVAREQKRSWKRYPNRPPTGGN